MNELGKSRQRAVAAEKRYTSTRSPADLLEAAEARLAAGDNETARQEAAALLEEADREPESIPLWLRERARAVVDAAEQDRLPGRLMTFPTSHRVIVHHDGVTVGCAAARWDGLVHDIQGARIAVVWLGDGKAGADAHRLLQTLALLHRGELHPDDAARSLSLDAVGLWMGERRRALVGRHQARRPAGGLEEILVLVFSPSDASAIDVVIRL